ncbi:MAG: hypothetical protein EBQ82_07800 [Betaproteobacteria bacterium]|nr:hypothetical protein [Betaproteobacteria bacterium]
MSPFEKRPSGRFFCGKWSGLKSRSETAISGYAGFLPSLRSDVVSPHTPRVGFYGSSSQHRWWVRRPD